MKVRDLAHKTIRNWPPVWTKLGRESKILKGEVGVLTDVYTNNEAESAIFVVIRFRAQKFIGALFLCDCSCRTLMLSLLQANVGRSIQEFAEMEI